jgi:hypothetical protein
MTDTIFKPDGEDLWPRIADGRVFKVHRIYNTSHGMGDCAHCKQDAFVQFVLYNPKDGLAGGKTQLFSCRKHASLFLEATHLEADRKVKAWDDGWEIACDFCGADCAEKPRVYMYVPTCKGASMAGRFASTLCDGCETMEGLFA